MPRERRERAELLPATRVIDFNRFRDAGEQSELTDAELELYDQAQERLVFGANFRRDSRGNPIEDGIGSPGRETRQHLAALEKEKELINRLKAEARLAAEVPAADLPPDPAALQRQIDDLKAQIAAMTPATEPAA
jgi:hypothetical protein